jgi:hypothetical protein
LKKRAYVDFNLYNHNEFLLKHLLCCRRVREEAIGYSKVQPTTSGSLIVMPKAKIVDKTGPIIAKSGATIGYLLAGQESITHTLLHTLLESTHILCSKGPLQKKYSSKRGEGLTMRIGFWRRYCLALYESADFKNKWSRWWATVNQPLWKFASNLLLKYFPTVHETLERVRVPHKFGAWHMAVLNVNLAVTPHRDDFDYKEGICCLIVFGEFEGGELCFPEEIVCIKVRNGTIVLFYSRMFTHVVSMFIGTRFSVVLHADEEVIKNDLI